LTTHSVAFSELGRSVPSLPGLGTKEVHIWAVDLRAEPDLIARLGNLLSSEERQRSARFHFARHRRRFTVGRGALRVLLGRQTGLSPSRLSFEHGPKGKPSLVQAPELEFNVSHSSERAVIALTRGGPVGIDIERLRDIEDADDIARRFFSPREVETYFAVDADRRKRAFFNCWTRKEAFVKALGEGLFLSLDRFDVSLIPGEPAQLLAIDGETEGARQWRLTELDLAPDFAGTVATTWSPTMIEAWQLPPKILEAG